MCVRLCACTSVCVCLSGGHQYCQWPGEGEGEGEGMNESSAETQGHLESLNQ